MERPKPQANPARRVYYDWDESTSPDTGLSAAFERTRPGSDFNDDDEPTLVRWALPALGLLLGGILLGRWWSSRKKSSTTTVVGSGFDEMGCDA
jgi:hypothetical protein